MRGWKAVGMALALVVPLAGFAAEKAAPATVKEASLVGITYRLTLQNGEVVEDKSAGPVLRFHPGKKEILPALEKALLPLKTGEALKVSLSPEEGYGAVDPQAMIEVELSRIPETSRKPGAVIIARGEDGEPHPVKVHEIREKTVVVNFNHPLAGHALLFDVTVQEME